MYKTISDFMQDFAPHAYSKNFDETIIKEIEDKLRKLTENQKNLEEIQKIFNGWEEHGSSSERHFASYFQSIIFKGGHK